MDSLYLDCALSSLILVGPSLYVSLSLKDSHVPSLLWFAFLLIFQQLMFALSASIFHSYAASLALGSMSVLLLGLKVRHMCKPTSALPTEMPAPHQWIYRLPWMVLLIVFIFYTAIRARYSFIDFINEGNHAGVEKLFNLSLQQSFLFGSEYPPEWIWLTGEPIKYYSFLRSIPGVASWISRILFNNSATGGVFFILSEAFFAALTPAVICGSIIWFGRKQKNQTAIAVVACLLGFFCFMSAHFQAIYLGLNALLHSTPLDWWSLTKLIPYTDNQYPVWLMILGDNHAYMQIYFLQVLCWACFIDLVLEEKLSPLKAAGLGIIASSILLSHPASVLIDVAVLGPFILVLTSFLICRRQWHYLRMCAQHGMIALLVMLFFTACLYNFGGSVKYVTPPSSLASRAFDFLKLNFSVFLWLGALLAHPAIFKKTWATFRSHAVFDEWVTALAALIAVCLYLLNLPALAIMVVSATLVYLTFYQKESSQQQQILALYAICSFSIWFLPEVFAFDHVLDNRTDWIRFQMSLRFWPEGYLLIPFTLSLAALPFLGDVQSSLRWN